MHAALNKGILKLSTDRLSGLVNFFSVQKVKNQLTFLDFNKELGVGDTVKSQRTSLRTLVYSWPVRLGCEKI